MPTQTLPPSAREYTRTQRHATTEAMGALREQWRRIGTDFDRGWLLVEPTVLAILDTAQTRAVEAADEWVPTILEDTGQRVERPDYTLNPRAIVGTAGDGLGTDTLAYESIIAAKTAVKSGASAYQGLAAGWRFLETAVPTLLADTRRTAEQTGTCARRVTGQTRALNPPSCGPCVILAGRWYPSNAGFLRHPKCDCAGIPTSESVAGDLLVDPHAYLDDLDDQALAKTLGSKANAQAWRDGADPAQLVNAYRRKGDVRTAQIYGRNVRYTTEGTTRHGRAYQAMSRARSFQSRQVDAPRMATRITRTGPELRTVRQTRAQTPRLMPASIYQIATDRQDAQRLLRLYGWI